MSTLCFDGLRTAGGPGPKKTAGYRMPQPEPFRWQKLPGQPRPAISYRAARRNLRRLLRAVE